MSLKSLSVIYIHMYYYILSININDIFWYENLKNKAITK